MHEQKHNIRHSEAEADIALIQYYENLYLSPVKQLGTKTELDIPAAEKKEPEEPKSSGKKKSELVKENMKENMKKKKEKAEEAKKKMAKHKK